MLESEVKGKLKCLCNDDRLCPLSLVETNEKRQCLTETVCLTKRYRSLKDGTQFLKYYCDDAFSNSMRENIIEYRDCKVNTSNEIDSKYVRENSAEYCCDTADFCNEFLNPKVSVKLLDEMIDSNNNIKNNNNNLHDHNAVSATKSTQLFTPINITFLSVFFVLSLILVFLFLIFQIKKRIKIKKKIRKNNNHLSSLSSASSGASSSSSSKSKSTTVTSVQTQLDNKADQILVKNNPKNFYLIHNKNELNKENINESDHSQVDNLQDSRKKHDYLSKYNADQNKLIKSLELYEPLIQNPNFNSNAQSKIPNYNFKENSMPSTFNNDFSTTSECCTSTTSGGLDSLISSNQMANNAFSNPNVTIMMSNTPYSINSTSSNNNFNGFEWSGSGSGAGVPQLLQRTIARQIKLIYPCIGKGRFGEVYKGIWRDEFIAVKTFNSAEEKSWENECSIYNTSGFRHENILGFIASDNIDRGTYTELWIITEYHDNGSLYDYLNQPNLKQNCFDTLKMALSIVNGLDHLHTAIESCTGKPALAHCDLKSKNILVKSDFTCCISDLGLALCGDKMGNVTQNPATIRTGTKRYMAPEILAKTINYKSLLQFQNAEMYSLALIFWELLRRTSFELDKEEQQASQSTVSLSKDPTNETSDKFPTKLVYSYDYKLPYYEYIQSDPDELEMKHLVVDLKKRPEINNLWRSVPILNELTQLTEELWVENADGRLNALRLKKSLNSIKRKYA